jgi:hypothetical protein
MGFPSCDIQTPSCTLLASVCISKGFEKSGLVNRVSLAIFFFIILKQLAWIGSQLYFTFADVIDVKGARTSDLAGHMSL